MFNHEFMPFQTVTIRPHWGQFCINELPVILLCLASYWISSFMEFRFHELLIWPALFYFLPVFSSGLYGKDRICPDRGAANHPSRCALPLNGLYRALSCRRLPAAPVVTPAALRSEDHHHLFRRQEQSPAGYGRHQSKGGYCQRDT